MKSLLVLFLVLFPYALGHPAILHVPADFTTIQEAIDAASQGDTVLVAPGTYVENIDFLGKEITVRSTLGAESTVIDGGEPPDPSSGSVVSFLNQEGPGTVLEGFTLANGTGSSDGLPRKDIYRGGGIICIESSPTILDCSIIGNAAHAGGGMALLKSSPVLRNCSFRNNSANKGGAILAWNGSSPKIMENIIEGNESFWEEGAGIQSSHSEFHITDSVIADNQGVGIHCYKSDAFIVNNILSGNIGSGIVCQQYAPTISGNILFNNATLYEGGGIHLWQSFAVVHNNMVIHNSAHRGGGIYCRGPALPGTKLSIVNNTITGNSAMYGGGIVCEYFENAHDLLVTNTILWDNVANFGTEIYLGGVMVSLPAVLDLRYSNVKGGQSSIHVGPGCTLNWGPGMMDSDPLFADPSQMDFHLIFNSPCRGSGDNTAPELPEVDFEGDPRIYQGVVDIGADEFYTHLYYRGEAIPGGDIQVKLIGLPGTGPVGLLVGSGILEEPIPNPWGNFWLEAPWFLVPLSPIPAEGILVWPAAIPLQPPAPWDLPMQGLVGLFPDSLTNPCILEVRGRGH
jgi:predicted outer membrane repeat protein